MSEIIVRIEMPKSCPCDLIGVGYNMYCSAANGIPKRVAEYDECVKNGTRPAWCPIIGELPEEHGRLIDAKHFEVVSYTENEVEQAGYCWRSFDDGVEWLLNQVDATPTIVPATERSEAKGEVIVVLYRVENKQFAAYEYLAGTRVDFEINNNRDLDYALELILNSINYINNH